MGSRVESALWAKRVAVGRVRIVTDRSPNPRLEGLVNHFPYLVDWRLVNAVTRKYSRNLVYDADLRNYSFDFALL